MAITDILKKAGRAILPESAEKAIGIGEKEEPVLKGEVTKKGLEYIRNAPEAPPKPSLLTRPINEVVSDYFRGKKEKEAELVAIKRTDPEKYYKIISPPPVKKQYVKKGDVTEREADLAHFDIMPGFTGITPVKSLAKKALKRVTTPAQSQVRNLIKGRYSEIKTGLLDSEVFVRNIERNLTKEEREQIPYIREGLAKGTPELRKWADEIGKYYDEGYDYLSKNFDNVGFVENYVNRIWDIPENRTKEVISRFTTKNPFLKKRAIPTLKEGLDMGLNPKTTDIAELLRTYDNYKFTTVANKRFVDGIKSFIDDTGRPLIQSSEKAPADYVSVDSWALGNNKVNPEIAKEVKTVLDKPFSGAAVNALDTIYAVTKKTALSLSFFHHYSLTEAAVSAGIEKKLIKMLNPYKIYRALRYKDYDIFKNIPTTKDAIEHQLNFGAIPDVQRHKVHRLLQQIEYKTRNIPIASKLTTGIRSFNEIWDRALWDYYHNGLKLYAYEANVANGLKINAKKGYPETTDEVKNRIAQAVNDTFGGQVWENFLVTPKGRQVAHWVLLSPDWTLSTLRQAQAPFSRGVRGRYGRKFWLKAAMYFGIGYNALNWVNTKMHEGKGKFMWENDPGRKSYVFLGYDENGEKLYLRPGKQYREIYEWATDPIKKFGAKLAPVTQEAMKQTSGYSPTGWQEEWAGKDFWDPEALKARAESMIKMGVPYSVSTMTRTKNLLGVTMPLRGGINWYEGRELMIDAIERRDEDYLTEIWRAALENNQDAKAIYDSAKSEVKLKMYPEYDEAEGLIKEIRNMGRTKGMEKLRKMRENGELSEEMLKRMRDVLEREQRVKEQRKRTGI